MTPPSTADDRDPLDLLAEQFMTRRRRGEPIDPERFLAEHPEHADRLRELLPTLMWLEEGRPSEPARSSERIGRWTIVRELGRGGMGVVYLAEDRDTGERAALKMMSDPSAGAVARFRREAEAVGRVRHPGICRVIEVGPSGGSAWIALEFVEGETLASALRREPLVEGKGSTEGAKSPIDRWLDVGEQVARALHAAHEAGLVHRDVKPANVMLTGGGRAVVLDFGLAAGAEGPETTRLTRTGVPVGTPAYMSPEQVRSSGQPLDRRTDVYSLGATLYEALTGEPPFAAPTVAALFGKILTSEAEPLRRRAPMLPKNLEILLATALEKRPERRYATALALAEDLARVRRGERIQARPVGPVRRLGRWALRNPRLATGLGSGVLALMVGLAVALVLLSRVAVARDEAAISGRHARSSALASASAQAMRTDAMLGLLLARAAVGAERTPETVSQLHAAVHGSLERARLGGHDAAVDDIAWDDAETLVSTGCRDGTGRVFGVDGTLRCTVPMPGLAGDARPSVALAPSGRALAMLGRDGGVRRFTTAGAALPDPEGAALPASQALFLSDDTLVVLGAGGRVSFHDGDGRMRASSTLPTGRDGAASSAHAVASGGQGPRLHVLTAAGEALTYDGSGVELHRHRHAADAARAVLFDGGRVAYSVPGPTEGEPTLNRASGRLLRVVGPDGTALGTLEMEFPAEARIRGGDTWWCAWEARAGAYLVDRQGADLVTRALDLQRSERPASLGASADGSRLLTSRAIGDTRVADSATTDPIRTWSSRGVPLGALTTGENVADAVALSPGGRFAALGLHSGGLVTVHATAAEELATVVPRWRRTEGFRHWPMVSGDGHAMVAVADETHLVVIRDDGSVRARIDIAAAGADRFRYLDLLRAKDRIAVTAGNGSVAFYDLDGRLLTSLPPDRSVQRAVWIGTAGAWMVVSSAPSARFHRPDGTLALEVAGRPLGPDPSRGVLIEVAVAQADGRVEVRGADGGLLRTLAVESASWYQSSRTGVAVLLDNGLLNPHGGSGLGACVVMDADGRRLFEVPVGGMGKRSAFISPDGERIAVPTSGGFSLRDAGGREMGLLHLPAGVSDGGFDAEGRQIVVSGLDGTVRVWDRDGRPRFTLPPQGGGSFVSLSDDGRRLAVVTATMARLYTTDTDELVALAARRSTRDFTPAERARFSALLDPPR